MKRSVLALAVAVILMSGSGCCLIDRLFHCGSPCGGGCGYGGHGCYDECYEGGPCYGGGCSSHGGGVGCSSCGGGGCSLCGPGGEGYVEPGPPSAHVTYPYYTTRGPRDYLASNPRGIGP